MTSSKVDVEKLKQAGIDKAAEYERAVLNRQITVGKWVMLAVQRNQRDHEDAYLRGWIFDEEAAARAIAFFSFLRHSKGEWKGQPVELAPWQCWIIACVYGWLNADTAKRRFRTVYEEIARKNGKTTKLAGIALKSLIKDDEGGPEIYSAATKRDQARLMFDEAAEMVRQSPPLRRRLQVQTHRILVAQGYGKFEPLSADAKSLDGLNPHAALIDELHAHPTSEIWDVLKSALGARLQPLIWAITTAGFNKNGICYEIRNYAQQVLSGAHVDDAFFAAIYAIDEDDDPFDERVWIKANPNLGVSVSADYLREQARQAKVMPRAKTNFLTKHLNVWVTGESLWCNVERWLDCGLAYTFEQLTEGAVEVYGGLDLASVSDIASFGLVVVYADGTWRTWHRHYLPEETVTARIQKSAVPYDEWERAGWLTLTPGNSCDYNWIKSDMLAICEALPVKRIHFDRWNSTQLVNDLLEVGVPMVGFGQGYVSMNAPMKELERRFLSGQIQHPNDPVLNWAMGNVVAEQDPAGNVKPAKNKSTEKIDPAVALIMAVGGAMQTEEPEPEPELIIL